MISTKDDLLCFTRFGWHFQKSNYDLHVHGICERQEWARRWWDISQGKWLCTENINKWWLLSVNRHEIDRQTSNIPEPIGLNRPLNWKHISFPSLHCVRQHAFRWWGFIQITPHGSCKWKEEITTQSITVNHAEANYLMCHFSGKLMARSLS